MKHSNIFKYVAGVAVLGFMTSCNDFLDQEPMSSVSPEKYLKDESQLEAYANKLYTDILPGHAYGYGLYGEDNHTDNQAGFGYNNRYIPGQWKLLNLREAHIALEIFIVVTTSLKKYCQSLKPAPFPEQKRKYANTSEKCISCAHTNISNASVHTVISLLSRLPYPTKWNRW